MNLTVRHLRAFLLVARHRSFNAAAARLSVSPPSVTAIIRQLEADAGLQLFERSTRHVELTAEGRAFVPMAECALEAFDGALTSLREMAERQSGRLSLATLPSISTLILPPVITTFSRLFPKVRVHLSDANASEVHRRVIDGDADIGIANKLPTTPDLAFEPLFRDRFVLVCRSDHRLARGSDPIGWASLVSEEFLALAPDTGIRPLVDAVPDLPSSVRNSRHEISNIATMGALLSSGLGVTALPRLAVPAFDQNLVFRELCDPATYREVGLITRREYRFSTAGRRMQTLLRDLRHQAKPLPGGGLEYHRMPDWPAS